MRFPAPLLVMLASSPALGQEVVWAEDFENGCVQNCALTTYSGPNGIWSTMSTGTNGACANIWFVSCQENGNPVGACGSGCGNNETLHIGNNASGCTSPNSCFFCPSGDCGAAYDASCPPALCFVCCSCQSSQSSTRAVSPIINLTGSATYTLRFKYMEGGASTIDNATLDYYDGATWSQLVDLPKTPTAGCAGQGRWTAYSIPLPASANNNPTVRIGFRWANDDDGAGTDPSVAIDDVEIIAPYTPTCIGPLINEVSNGATGNKKYIELLVCGPPCGTVDLRLWKIDDNNGVLMNGFGTDQAGSGASAGHLRFSNAAQWAAVPVGSLIVIYNQADVNPLLPPADPSDASPNDEVYVLPANSLLLEGCSTTPDPAGSANYAVGCAFGAANWNYVTTRNQGDAVQTRDPQGHYFHGISYGPDALAMNAGGIDGLRISLLDHTGRVIFFNNGNERLAANFTSAVVAGNETPGAPNNAANLAYMDGLECGALPVELLSFTAEPMGAFVRLRWATASEHNSARFFLERSFEVSDFTTLGELAAAGFSQHRIDYAWDDRFPLAGTSYYRLRERDLDGAEQTGPMVAVDRQTTEVGVQPLQSASALLLTSPTGGFVWSLLDPLGRELARGEGVGGTVRVEVPEGLSLLEIAYAGEVRVFRVAGVSEGAFAERVR
jgi:hypothetical protein